MFNITYFYFKRGGVIRRVAQCIKLPLGMQQPISVDLDLSPSFNFDPSFWLMHTLGGSNDEAQVLESLLCRCETQPESWHQVLHTFREWTVDRRWSLSNKTKIGKNFFTTKKRVVFPKFVWQSGEPRFHCFHEFITGKWNIRNYIISGTLEIM